MLSIIPAILSTGEGEFREKLSRVWGFAGRVQLDVIDGVFAELQTVMPEILLDFDTVVKFDAHLMVNEPARWVKRCFDAGIDRLFGQVELMKNKTVFVADAQASGMQVGLAYDIDTPLFGLGELIDDLDGVLLMSVKAGAGGQVFDERVLSKIKQVRRLSKTVKIMIDGGLDEQRIKQCLVAEWEEEIEEEELNRSVKGMEFVVGSHLFDKENIKMEFEALRTLRKHGKLN
jgi:ribulose-phosphate 3-epimerase